MAVTGFVRGVTSQRNSMASNFEFELKEYLLKSNSDLFSLARGPTG